MINPFSSITSYTGKDFDAYLKKVGLFEVFESLFKEFPDVSLFKGSVKFILFGYSLESEVLHSTGITWLMMSKIIYEKSGLPEDDEEIFDKVANLKSDAVRESIDKWLSLQNSEALADYTHARDLRKHCLQTSQTAEKIKEKMEALKYAKELLLMMEDAKSKFVENYEILKPSLTALKKEKQKNTLGPQDFAT